MLGRTHISLGLLISLLVLPFVGVSFNSGDLNTTALLVAVIGALLPDLDMGTSSLSGKFGIIKAKHIKKIWIITLTLMSIGTIVFLKSTPIFYGIAFIIFMGFILADKFAKKGYYMMRNFVQALVGVTIILASYYYKHYYLALLGVILIILLLSKHRGLSHSIVFLVGCSYTVRLISLYYGDVDYGIIFFISMATHLLGDMLTKAGIGLLLPFSNKRIKLPFGMKTGGKIEKIIFIGALLGIFKLLKG